MLLAKMKEALSRLYEDIEQAPEPVAAEVLPDEAAAEAAGAEDVQPEEAGPAAETGPQQEEAQGDEGEEPEAAPAPGPKETDYAAKGYHLDVDLSPAKVPEAAEILLRENFFIESITGVDWIDEQQLEAVYDFNHFDELCRIVIRTTTDRDNPEIPTISHIYQGANWHEREAHDFFGIKFIGHPDLSPLLLPEDADFHPLLKDFKA
ncbi:MAG: NADH-quinone oxidoreductase subunit C [Desulfobulbales bacterium]|nr:NADH-quinone oxidoreductase subunit C [Desulfobulbales bacterium]